MERDNAARLKSSLGVSTAAESAGADMSSLVSPAEDSVRRIKFQLDTFKAGRSGSGHESTGDRFIAMSTSSPSPMTQDARRTSRDFSIARLLDAQQPWCASRVRAMPMDLRCCRGGSGRTLTKSTELERRPGNEQVWCEGRLNVTAGDAELERRSSSEHQRRLLLPGFVVDDVCTSTCSCTAQISAERPPRHPQPQHHCQGSYNFISPSKNGSQEKKQKQNKNTIH